MRRLHPLSECALVLVMLLGTVDTVQAMEISGTIATTLVIFDDSELVGDVTCTVVGAPCIAFGAPDITLKLNGFAMTGLGNAKTGCGGTAVANEFGIDINTQRGDVIRGPGLIQQFRNQGIRLLNSTGARVTQVTLSTNCSSGIILVAGSDNELDRNISVRNGNGAAPCGGI
jgi:hypothetical protein